MDEYKTTTQNERLTPASYINPEGIDIKTNTNPKEVGIKTFDNR